MFALLAFVAFVGPRSVAAQSRGGSEQSVDLLSEQAAAQEATRRAELVASILSARETASGHTFSADLRSYLSGKLATAPIASLEAFASAGGLGNMNLLQPNALGDAGADLVFTPVTPCRVVDTRSAATGILVAGASQSFLVRNAGGFAAQGGSATDCGIPATATSVEMNFVSVSPVGPGDLRAVAFPGAFPNASVLNYSNVSVAPLLNIANGIAQPVCNVAVQPCTKDLTVVADASNTHLVIDVVGYYNKAGLPVLHSGQTVFGSIGAQYQVPGAGEVAATASLPIPAPVGLDDAHVQVFGSGGEGTAAQCPGTALNPSAAPGYVCMYPFFTSNVGATPTGFIWGAGDGTKVGFQISWVPPAGGLTVFFANWAYTAP